MSPFLAHHAQLQALQGGAGTLTVGEARARRRAQPRSRQGNPPLQRLNQSWLDALVRQGYLRRAPTLRHREATRRSVCWVDVIGHGAPVIELCESDAGWVFPAPDFGQSHLQALPTDPAWSHRWLLAHEAGHAAMSELACPFVHADPWVAAILNRSVLGPFAFQMSPLAQGFGEFFADVFATLVLAHQVGPHPGLDQEVRTLIALRQANRTWAPAECLYRTDQALSRVWTDRAQWQDRPAAELVSWAQRYASSGWLDQIQENVGPWTCDRVLEAVARSWEEGAWVDHQEMAWYHPERARLHQWAGSYTDDALLSTLRSVAQGLPHRRPRWVWDDRPRRDAYRAALKDALRPHGAAIRATLVRDQEVLVERLPQVFQARAA